MSQCEWTFSIAPIANFKTLAFVNKSLQSEFLIKFFFAFAIFSAGFRETRDRVWMPCLSISTESLERTAKSKMSRYCFLLFQFERFLFVCCCVLEALCDAKENAIISVHMGRRFSSYRTLKENLLSLRRRSPRPIVMLWTHNKYVNNSFVVSNFETWRWRYQQRERSISSIADLGKVTLDWLSNCSISSIAQHRLWSSLDACFAYNQNNRNSLRLLKRRMNRKIMFLRETANIAADCLLWTRNY